MSQVVLAAAIIGGAYYLSTQVSETEGGGAASNTSGGLFSILGSNFDQLRRSIAAESEARAGLSKLIAGNQQVIGGLGSHLNVLTQGQQGLKAMIDRLSGMQGWMPDMPEIPQFIRDLTAGGPLQLPDMPGYAPKPDGGKTWSKKANEAGMGLMEIPWEFGKGALWDYPYSQGLKMREAVNAWISKLKAIETPSLGRLPGEAGSKLASIAAISKFVAPLSVFPAPISTLAMLVQVLPGRASSSVKTPTIKERMTSSYTPTSITGPSSGAGDKASSAWNLTSALGSLKSRHAGNSRISFGSGF